VWLILVSKRTDLALLLDGRYGRRSAVALSGWQQVGQNWRSTARWKWPLTYWKRPQMYAAKHIEIHI